MINFNSDLYSRERTFPNFHTLMHREITMQPIPTNVSIQTTSLVKALLLYMIAKSQNSIFDTPTYIALLSVFFPPIYCVHLIIQGITIYQKTMRNEFHSALHIYQDHNDFYWYVSRNST